MRAPRPSVRWAWWLPALLGGIYVLLILVHLRQILDSVWLSSDNTIDGVLAHVSLHAPRGALYTTGDFPHYETLAFTLLTRSLPFYRSLWMLTPVVCLVVGVAAVGWSVARVFGPWAAALSLAGLVCFGGGGHPMITAGGLASVLSIDAHGNSIVTAAVVGGAVTWLVPRAHKLQLPVLIGAALVLGLLGGLPLAGDSLYLAWGVAPLIAVTTVSAWRGPQRHLIRVLSFCLGTLITTAVVAAVFAAIMHGQGVRGFAASRNGYLTFATPQKLITNFETVLHALPLIAAANFYGVRATLHSEFELVAAVLLFTALITVLARVRHLAAVATPRQDGGGDPVEGRVIHTAWWTTVLVMGLAIVLVGSPNPISTDGRYLLGPFFAIAALLPLIPHENLGWKLAVTAAVSLFAFNAVFQFNSGVLNGIPRGYTSGGTARALASYAQREHVAVGYGDYWDSINLMWNSDFRVNVYPVQPCNRHPAQLCTFDEISASGWNTPRAGVRSMLVVDPTGRLIHSRDSALGRPIAQTSIANLRIYVYPYDIASRLRHQTSLTL